MFLKELIVQLPKHSLEYLQKKNSILELAVARKGVIELRILS